MVWTSESCFVHKMHSLVVIFYFLFFCNSFPLKWHLCGITVIMYCREHHQQLCVFPAYFLFLVLCIFLTHISKCLFVFQVPRKLNLHPDVVENLLALSLSPPSTYVDIPKVLEELQERRVS